MQISGNFNRGSLNNSARNDGTQNLSDAVYSEYLGLGSDSGGLPYDTVLHKLQRKNVNMSMEQLMRTVQQLCDDGRLYSTIDENHYRPTGEDN